MPDKPRIYVESCCFIDAAKEAVGVANQQRNSDVWFLWKFLEANKAKDAEIFTSVLTIAESTHADGNEDARVRNLFDRVLMSGQHCVLVQPTPFIGEDARNLRWKNGIKLGGADGLHVASGLVKKCQEFLTTDKQILAHAAQIGALGMRVCTPSQTVLLPDKYLQGDLLDQNVTPLRRPAK
jgi:hypothetical protein